ncbi:thioredoxin-disulfide reductase [Ceratobasidium sp. 423]|nr:thioredoxin-disulfide reductase [Ceratobasidium sp. 423]
MAPIRPDTKGPNGRSTVLHSKVVIIGSGPAGHTAAIYLARANLEPGFMANGFAAGGQLTTTTDVENFPGFPEGVNGTDMMNKFRAQSIRFGTKIITETVSQLDLSRRPFRYWREGAEDAEPETADTIILATGASAKRMNLPGEDTYWQSGISACAVCDGAVPIFRNKPLAVIGGGDSAAEEATYLTKYASHPATALVREQLQTDAEGYIITKAGTAQTSVKGVFAAGDVQDKRYRQAVTSAGSGCMAALEAERLLAEEEEL